MKLNVCFLLKHNIGDCIVHLNGCEHICVTEVDAIGDCELCSLLIVDEIKDLKVLYNVFVAQGERHSLGQERNKEVLDKIRCCLSLAIGGLPQM